MEESQEKAETHRTGRIMLKILAICLFLFFFLTIGFYFILKDNGELIFRSYIQNKINAESKGLYHVEFNKLKINLASGTVMITEFMMTPDTALYAGLKRAGKTQNALYIISFKSLTLSQADLWKMYRLDEVLINNLNITQPEILIVAFPDTTGEKKGEFTHLYEDIYPVISRYFKSFHIDSINVADGMFYSKHTSKAGKSAEGNYTYSAILRDFDIRPGSFAESKRVFYSSDIELTVNHFRYSLADSMYFLTAAKAGFSLKQARIYGNDIALVPNYGSERIRAIRDGALYRIDLPDLNITGVDVYKTLVDRRVEISNVRLDNFNLKMTSNNASNGPRSVSGKGSGTGKKFILADLYTIISGELKSVTVGNFILNNAGFEYYRKNEDTVPEIKIPVVSVTMDHFFLDSLAHRDLGKILYAQEIDLRIFGFLLRLHDKIHSLQAGEIRVSTKNSLIEISNLSLLPERTKITTNDTTRSILKILIPAFAIRNVDIKKAFNNRILGFDLLEITNPEMKIILNSTKPKIARQDNNSGAIDGMESGDLLFKFISPYFNTVKVKNVLVHNCMFSIIRNPKRNNETTSSGKASLGLRDFLVDSVHYRDQARLFYSRDIDITLSPFSFDAKRSHTRISAEKLTLSADDSLTEAFDLKAEIRPEKGASIDFRLEQLHLKGISNEKLLNENILQAKQMTLVKPHLVIKYEQPATGKKAQQDELPGQITELVRSVAVDQTRIKSAAVDYTGFVDDHRTSLDFNACHFFLSKLFFIPGEIQPGNDRLKFDSLQMTIDADGRILFDSSYSLTFKSASVHSPPSVMVVKDLRFSATGRESGETGMSAIFYTPELSITGYPLNALLHKNDLFLDNVTLKGADIAISLPEKTPMAKSDPGRNEKEPPGRGLFSRKIRIGRLESEHVNLSVDRPGIGILSQIRVDEFSFSARNLVFDTTLTNDLSRFLDSEDIVISIPGYSWASEDSLYKWKLGGIRLSTGNRHVSIDSISMTPGFSREEFSKRIGFQQDRLDIRINRADFSNINFRDLVEHRKLYAEKLTLTGSFLDSYRDKRVPLPEWKRKPLPVKMLQELPFPMTIDTIQLVNGFARYSEQTGKEPGTIFFDRMNAMATNVTNDPSRYDKGTILGLTGSTYLLGKAPIEASFRFPLITGQDTFSFSAEIGPLDLTDLNQMIIPLQPARIASGKEKRTSISYVNANDSFASGLLNIWYNDLNVKITDTKSNVFNKWKTDFLNFIFDDIVLPSNNPGSKGKLRDGIIFFERDKRKGFFNYVWKIMFSGLKSSVGINTRQQRDLRKIRKTEETN